MKLTENELRELLSENNSGISEDLLRHMKRHYPFIEVKFEWADKPFKQIKVGGKVRNLEGNKKYLTNLISNELESQWIFLGIPKIRRTVKKYLDGIK